MNRFSEVNSWFLRSERDEKMGQRPIVAVDLMGGDNAPQANIDGCKMALREGYNLLVLGSENAVGQLKGQKGVLCEICQDVILPEDSPVRAIRRKVRSSLVRGITAVKEKRAGGIVSGGPTGALVAGGVLLLGRSPNVDKPCIATVFPTKDNKGVLFLDLGASSEVRKDTLLRFAYMGSIYAQEVMGRKNPKVALLNIGVEKEKGNAVVKDAFKLLADSPLNFQGNIEARDILFGGQDVVVTDGFSGNIFLKACEGVSEFLLGSLKEEIKKSSLSKMAALFLRKAFKRVNESLDYTQYGGAPLLGLEGCVVKCHGSSNALAVYNGIKQAEMFISKYVSKTISETLAAVPLEGGAL